MNSFNHYAFGAIGEWMYARWPASIWTRTSRRRATPIGARGFSLVRRERRTPEGMPIHCASAALDSMYGRYEVKWGITAAVSCWIVRSGELFRKGHFAGRRYT